MDFEQVYDSYYLQVYSYMMLLCRDAGMAEEMTQKAFVKALDKKETFRGESDIYHWLCGIAKNIYIDDLRRQKRVTELPEELEHPEDFVQKLVNEDQAMGIYAALHSLEEPYKEVFYLRVFGELSYARIGQLFGKSESWGRVIYYRAKVKIREILDKE